jgi:uncharacterized protein YqfB (UPF0267 family)
MFRRQFVEPILAGRKTATIRDLRTPQPPVGEELELRTHWTQPPFARAVVTDAATIPVDALTRGDALREAMRSRAELLEVVRAIYPHARKVRVIGFRLLE